MKAQERKEQILTLKTRFDKNMHRHRGVDWADMQAKLELKPAAINSLYAMEITGGEPNVIGRGETGIYLFCDCSAESPIGRRSICYDPEALESRKENKPKDSALGMAAAMGVELLSESHYRELQLLQVVDTKTSSWVSTAPEIRALGGALFCDRRYGTVFVYHNGAESYYAARGFRGSLSV